MDGWDAVHAYNGTVLSLEKNEILTLAAAWTHTEIMLKQASHLETNTVGLHLYEAQQTSKSQHQNIEPWWPGPGGMGEVGSGCLAGREFGSAG